MRARRCEIHGFSANEIGNDADSVQMARLQQRRHPGMSDGSVRYWRAPWKGGAFQWVQVPPGKRSSRKQPEQLWR